MPAEQHTPPQNADLTRILNEATSAPAVAVADALNAYMDAAGTPQDIRRGVIVLRDAGDFAHQAAVELACGGAVWAPEAGLQYKWSVWKLIEFARMLPPKSRGIAKRWLDTLSEPALRPKRNGAGSKRSAPKQAK